MIRYVFLGFVVFGCLMVASHSNAAIVEFNLQGRAGLGLLPGNENPGNATVVSGGEIGTGITFDDVTKILTIQVGWGSNLGFTGSLTGVATAAHIHASTSFTSNGGVLFGLDGAPFFFNSAANGGLIVGNSAALTAAQEGRLMAGELYINVHTAANPGGEIRGNLVAVPEPSSMALACVALAGFGVWKRRKKKQA